MDTHAPAQPPVWSKFFQNISDHSLTSQAAAIAYYASLSLAPLVLLALAILGALYPAAQERFIDDVGALVGSDGRQMIRTIVESAADKPDLRKLAGWVGVVVLLGSASAVFAQMQEALNRIWDAQSQALSGLRVLWGHVLPNAMLPVLTTLGGTLPYLFMGSLVIESFFGLPGLGAYTVEAISAQDFAVVRSMVFIGAALYIASNTLIDILYTVADPRVRLE